MPHANLPGPEERPALRDAALRRLLRIRGPRVEGRTVPRPAWRRLWRDRRGVTAILLALGLPMMIGFAGLGVETGLWYTTKWQNQSAADNAALSAALELGAGNGCADYSKMAVYAAGQDGFTPTSSSLPCPGSGSNCTTGALSICVNSPPLSGLNDCANNASNCSNYVEVILTQTQNTLLAHLAFLGLPSVTIGSRAVASWGSGGGTACILALDKTASDAVDIGGFGQSASVSLTNCWVASNSTSATSIATAGAGTPTCPPSTTGLCVYDIWTAGNYNPAGIALTGPLPAVTNAAAVVDTYAPGKSNAVSENAGSCGTNTFGVLGYATSNTLAGGYTLSFKKSGIAYTKLANGMYIADLSETSGAIIPDGTTISTVSVLGANVTVTMSNPVAAGAEVKGSSNGKAGGADEIQFTASNSLLPWTPVCAPVDLVTGTYILPSGVYFIDGEQAAVGIAHKGLSIQGIALYVGGAAVVQCQDTDGKCDSGVTIVVYGTSASDQAGSFDVNCSFSFTGSGSLALAAPTATATTTQNGITATIPAGLLFYQNPAHADTGAAGDVGAGTATCQARGHGHGPPNTIVFGSGLTVSNESVIYTPATEFDFAGTSTLCTILDADVVYFGLSVTTSLTYNQSTACTNLSPPAIVATGLAE